METAQGMMLDGQTGCRAGATTHAKAKGRLAANESA